MMRYTIRNGRLAYFCWICGEAEGSRRNTIIWLPHSIGCTTIGQELVDPGWKELSRGGVLHVYVFLITSHWDAAKRPYYHHCFFCRPDAAKRTFTQKNLHVRGGCGARRSRVTSERNMGEGLRPPHPAATQARGWMHGEYMRKGHVETV